MSFELDDKYYIINWSIYTFDRQKRQLPLEVRHYHLDGDQLTDHQRRSIVAMLETGDPIGAAERGKSDVDVTISHSVSADCTAIRQYRPLFRPSSGLLEPGLLQSGRKRLTRMLSVPILLHYIEDETGSPMTMTEVIRIVKGCNEVVLLGDVESVLLIGPVGLRTDQIWSKAIANQLQHFLEIVEHILNSNWLRTPVSMSFRGDERSPLEVVFPVSEQTRSVVLLFRQLWSSNPSDNLFNKSCDLYSKLCSSEAKVAWVRHEQGLFARSLAGPPHFPPGAVLTPVAELVETVFYGAKIGHAQSRYDAESKLKLLGTQYGYDRLRFAFHSSLRNLLSYAHNVYYPIRQDFHHWLSMGLERPDIIGLTEF